MPKQGNGGGMFYCVTTASGEELSSGDLDSFLGSVHDQELRVILILRGASDSQAASYSSRPNVCAVLRIASGGISVVRNLGLSYLNRMNPDENDVVSFPDDDCRYPPGLVAKIISEFQSTGAELIVGSYGEHEVRDEESMPLGVEDAAYRSSSVALFVRWSLVRKIGGFNESLGVGSGVFSYGEDNDFALRAFDASSHSISKKSLRVWHLEERPTTGRNPKGYLTSCSLNLGVQGVGRIMFRGIASSLFQDIRYFPQPFLNIRFTVMALNPSKLRLARSERKSLLPMTRGRG